MSDLKNRINEDIKSAMRGRDKEKLATLRMIMAGIKQQEVDNRAEPDDTRIIAMLDKMARQHRDSIEQFEQAGRDDLVARENRELQIVREYLPLPLDEAELTRLINDAIKQAGAAGIKDMGKVMGILKPQVQGRADMATVSSRVKELLA